MACPSEKNEDGKHAEKLQKYQQLRFEIRERAPGYNEMIISIVIRCLGGDLRRVTNQIGRLIPDKKKTRAILNEIVKTAQLESESIKRKVDRTDAQEE